MKFKIKVTYRDRFTQVGQEVRCHDFSGETWYAAFYAADEQIRPQYSDKTLVAITVEVDET